MLCLTNPFLHFYHVQTWCYFSQTFDDPTVHHGDGYLAWCTKIVLAWESQRAHVIYIRESALNYHHIFYLQNGKKSLSIFNLFCLQWIFLAIFYYVNCKNCKLYWWSKIMAKLKVFGIYFYKAICSNLKFLVCILIKMYVAIF